jgi:hypothetical protein
MQALHGNGPNSKNSVLSDISDTQISLKLGSINPVLVMHYS